MGWQSPPGTGVETGFPIRSLWELTQPNITQIVPREYPNIRLLNPNICLNLFRVARMEHPNIFDGWNWVDMSMVVDFSRQDMPGSITRVCVKEDTPKFHVWPCFPYRKTSVNNTWLEYPQFHLRTKESLTIHLTTLCGSSGTPFFEPYFAVPAACPTCRSARSWRLRRKKYKEDLGKVLALGLI